MSFNMPAAIDKQPGKEIDLKQSMPTETVRNIGILAHIDAGKTSLTERLLHVAGSRPVAGGVDEGTTATDYLAVERERGITVKAASVNLQWKGISVHLIDTPGHVDFGAEVDRSIRALDGAILAICAVAGVQSRTEVLVEACKKKALPRLAFVNKEDRRGANFLSVVDDLRLGCEPKILAVQMPWGEGCDFRGILDLIEMKAYEVQDETPELWNTRESHSRGYAAVSQEIPPELLPEASTLHALILERLADNDASIMEDYVSGRHVSPRRMKDSLKRAVLALEIVPALCGTAFRDLPATLLLDAVSDYLPSPGDAATPEGIDPKSGARITRKPNRDDPFSALVFKTSSDLQNGRLCWSRVWSGCLRSGGRVLDSRSNAIIKVKKIFTIQADAMAEASMAVAGDIVAFSLVASSASGGAGATLCDPSHPILYEQMRIREPVVSIAIEPRASADISRTGAALRALASEDSALRVTEDGQTGAYLLSGLGELHLEVAIERLSSEYGVRVRTGKPRVAYREAPTKKASNREEFDRDIGGERIRTAVEVVLLPAGGGTGINIEMEEGLRLPAVWIDAARRGLASALATGSFAGHPLEDVKAIIKDIQIPSGSGRLQEMAVEAAAAICGRNCLSNASCILMEPVMKVEIEVPDDFFGAATGLVTSKGGRLESVDDIPGGKLIVAVAALRILFGFATELRSSTEGKAIFQARFFRYEPAPSSISGT
jgi:elongation factor G